MAAACDGLVVVDFGQGMAGSMPGMILADNGATVTHVEPPWGAWGSDQPGYLLWNRGKQRAVIDLRDPDERRDAQDLIREADIVIESFKPGAAERLGVGYEANAVTNPRIIHCAVGGLGDLPATAGVPAYEGLVAAMSGRMTGLDHLSGAVDGADTDRPIFTVPPVASYAAAQLAVQGILAALLERQGSGRGQRVSTDLVRASTVFLMRQELSRGDRSGPIAPISPTAHRGIELCFLTALCADDRYIQMCARQDDHFRRWLQALDLGDLADDPRYVGGPLRIERMDDLDELEKRIRDRMRQRSSDAWMELFVANDIGADPFLTPEEFLQHPDMVDNGRVVELDHPTVGRIRTLGPLVHLADTPSPVGRAASTVNPRGAPPAARTDARPRRNNPVAAALTTDAPDPALPLAGVTILEAAYFIAGPMATTLLADLGARVIKVEPLAGDPYRRTGLQAAKFLHGKESIALDLKADEGREILHRLVAASDALVHSFRPGVPERLGLDYETVRNLNPALLYLYAASYGSNGPQRKRAAFHSTPTALSGSGILQAGRGNPPVDDSYPDPGSAVAAATALLLGLWAREATGRGQYLETTMLTSTGYIMSNELVLYEGLGERPIPDHGQHGYNAGYRLYETRDGWVFVAAATSAERHALAQHFDVPAPAGDTASAADDGAAATIATALAAQFTNDALRALAGAGVPAVAVPSVTQDRWLESAGLLVAASHPAFGDYWRLPQKVTFSRSTTSSRPPAAIGEHSRTLLAELGYADDAIDSLIERGVAGAPPASDEPVATAGVNRGTS